MQSVMTSTGHWSESKAHLTIVQAMSSETLSTVDVLEWAEAS